MVNDSYKDYLVDLIFIIKPEVQRAMKRYKKLSDRQNDDPKNFGYITGYAHAYSRVVSLMRQQAEVRDVKEQLWIDNMLAPQSKPTGF